MTERVYESALRHKLLTKEREVELLTQYATLRAKHGPEHKSVIAVRNRIVESNLRLVAKVALRYRSQPFEDLIGEGAQGLIIAVERFEVARGLRFGTYATFWVRHAIQRAVENTASTVRIPVHMQAKRRHGEGPREGVDLGGPALSLDAPLGDSGDDRSFHDVVADESDGAASQLEGFRVSEDVRRMVFSVLTPKEREIVESRYLRDREETLSEVGERFDLSRERIRQIEAIAFRKMRRALERLGVTTGVGT